MLYTYFPCQLILFLLFIIFLLLNITLMVITLEELNFNRILTIIFIYPLIFFLKTYLYTYSYAGLNIIFTLLPFYFNLLD